MAQDQPASRPHPRRRALAVAAWFVAFVVLLGAGGVTFLYFKFNGNLKGVDINGQLGGDRPGDVDNGSMDILVLGSDSRAGSNKSVGGGGTGDSARSDTAMVVHVYKGHKKAGVVSIPRDTLVDRPSCRKDDGKTVPAADHVMFNEAYEVGGPACSVKTVEDMTGIRMDHYVEIDFSGFRNLVDALGGVTVTTKEPIHDKDSHLDLPAGTHHLGGQEALGFVRTRHGIGDGSDLGRIGLQQQFMVGLLKRVDQIDLFGNPKKLYDVAEAATKAITTDSEIASIRKVVDLGESLKGINAKDLDTVMLPVKYDPADPNRVIPDEPDARHVWSALRGDRPIPQSAHGHGPGQAPSEDTGDSGGDGGGDGDGGGE